MAITTENTFLGMSTDGKAYTKLIDIKEFPDLGGAPATVEITTLTDHMKTYLNGLVDPGSLEFNCNYDKDDYSTVKALEGATKHYCIAFGTAGGDGIFVFDGEASVWIKGGGTEASVDMGVAIAPSTEITIAGTGITFSATAA